MRGKKTRVLRKLGLVKGLLSVMYVKLMKEEVDREYMISRLSAALENLNEAIRTLERCEVVK